MSVRTCAGNGAPHGEAERLERLSHSVQLAVAVVQRGIAKERVILLAGKCTLAITIPAADQPDW